MGYGILIGQDLPTLPGPWPCLRRRRSPPQHPLGQSLSARNEEDDSEEAREAERLPDRRNTGHDHSAWLIRNKYGKKLYCKVISRFVFWIGACNLAKRLERYPKKSFQLAKDRNTYPITQTNGNKRANERIKDKCMIFICTKIGAHDSSC